MWLSLGGYSRRVPGLRRIAIAAVALLAAVVLVLTVTVVVTVRRPLPEYSGEVQVAGLGAEVQVLRDEQGVPQIYADSSDDLFYAQGFVHAQDRFFEMDFRRHVTSGRLSELVGDNEEALQADIVVRTLGWRRVAEQELPLLNPETQRYLQAYADGVNAYIGERSPSELSAAYPVLATENDLRRIEEWTPLDSLAWLKAMAWDLRTNYDDELGRAQVYGALAIDDDAAKVARVEELYPPYDPTRHAPILPTAVQAGSSLDGALNADGAAGSATETAGGSVAPDPEIQAAGDVFAAAQRALDSVPELLGRGDGVGSNSWVVSGQFTESGKPMLANDPHLEPGMPGIWYQVGLHCTDVGEECPFDVAGYSFAGLPGIVIGHNAQIAWGMTNLGPDVSDFFLEKLSGDNYKRDNAQVPVESRVETIEVAGAPSVEIEIRSTVHGPLISDASEAVRQAGTSPPPLEGAPFAGEGYEVALSWTALTPGRTADALFALDTAQDWDDFRAAAEFFEVPSQNLVYADREGHIGYQTPGKIPVRPTGEGLGRADGTWPRAGWDSSWDWTGYVPFEQLPTSLDPMAGFIVAANQQVTDGPGPYLTSDWDYGYRSQRIRDVLTAATADGGTVDAQDMRDLQMDTTNGFAQVLVPMLVEAPPADFELDPRMRRFTAEAVDMLRDWDYTQPADSPEAAYYNAVWSNLLELTFHDELPEEARPNGGGRWFEVMRALLLEENKGSPWWDNASTPTISESRDQIIGQALRDARLELTTSLGKDPETWEWGKLHTLTLQQQPLGGDSVPGPVRALFNSDRTQVGGGPSIVNATAWDASEVGTYEVTAVPSMRMVVDLGDLDASTWVDLTGISGHPWSPHYGDQFEAWAKGESFAWPFSRGAVEASSRDTLVLTPSEQ